MALQNLGIILLLLNNLQKTIPYWYMDHLKEFDALWRRFASVRVCVCVIENVFFGNWLLTCLVGMSKLVFWVWAEEALCGRRWSLACWRYHWLPLSLLLQLVFDAVYLGSYCRSWWGFVSILWGEVIVREYGVCWVEKWSEFIVDLVRR